jgi:hypothetical protein
MNDFVSQLKTKQSRVAASEWLPPPAVVYAYARQTFLTSRILATDIQGLISNHLQNSCEEPLLIKFLLPNQRLEMYPNAS